VGGSVTDNIPKARWHANLGCTDNMRSKRLARPFGWISRHLIVEAVDQQRLGIRILGHQLAVNNRVTARLYQLSISRTYPLQVLQACVRRLPDADACIREARNPQEATHFFDVIVRVGINVVMDRLQGVQCGEIRVLLDRRQSRHMTTSKLVKERRKGCVNS
jgi:hypothetical protein